MAKRKDLFLTFLIALFVSASSFLFSGCSALPPYKACVDCTQFPLVYQGTITGYTQGVYLETACITIDLSKVTGGQDFEIGDIIYLEYVIKQGEFCSPDDNSVYRIYDVDGPQPDSPYDGIQVNGSAIQMKEQSSAEIPIIPVLSFLMLAGLFNFGAGYTPIMNSRTKVGVWIAGLTGIAFIVASFFPDSGIVWEATVQEKATALISIVAFLFGATGVRNLIDDVIKAIKEGKDPKIE